MYVWHQINSLFGWWNFIHYIIFTTFSLRFFPSLIPSFPMNSIHPLFLFLLSSILLCHNISVCNLFPAESNIFQYYLEGENILQRCSSSNVNGWYTLICRIEIQVLRHTEMYQKTYHVMKSYCCCSRRGATFQSAHILDIMPAL